MVPWPVTKFKTFHLESQYLEYVQNRLNGRPKKINLISPTYGPLGIVGDLKR